MTKDFGLHFLIPSSVTNLREQFVWVHRVFWQGYCGSYKVLSVKPKRLLKTQSFEENPIFPVKKKFHLFFLVLSNMKTVIEQLKRHTRYSDKYCASYIILSAGPKKPRNKVFKKRLSSRLQNILSFFSRIVESSKPQEMTYEDPQSILTIILQVIRSFLKDLKFE